MITLLGALVLIALLLTVGAMVERVPLWAPVFVLVMIAALQVWH